ncbi:MAG: hypothetical protein ACRDK7_05795 [Solirubrobacteraceae bacterium]
MSTRYLTNLALALIGGALVVVSQAFSVGLFMWVMLGVGIATILIAAPGVAFPARGNTQRGLDYLFCLLGAWTIVASAVFGGAAVTWLGFASGIGLVAIAVAGLTAHELSTERVVHSLEVSPERSRERDLAGVA